MQIHGAPRLIFVYKPRLPGGTTSFIYSRKLMEAFRMKLPGG